MGKPYYVKFETPADLVSPILEALRVAASSGKVKKGTNEATKAIERGSLPIFQFYVRNRVQHLSLFQLNKNWVIH